MKKRIFLPVALACVLQLAACSRAPSHPPVPPPDSAGAVAAIRALGAHYETSVQVNAVRDPAVDGFVAAAKVQEAQGEFQAARDEVDKALRIAARAPELLQYAAELSIEAGDWKLAGELARQSWNLGPKVGGLCARNLETMARSLVVQGDAGGAAATRAQIDACRIPPVTRY